MRFGRTSVVRLLPDSSGPSFTDSAVNVPSSETVADWLTSALAQGNETTHCQVHEIVTHGVNPSSHTWLARTSSADDEQHLFVKHQHTRPMYEREKKALLMMRPYASANDPYSAPRIVAWSDDLHLIAMSCITGCPVGPLLRSAVGVASSTRCLSEGIQLAYDIGSWLSHFERRTALASTGPFPRVEFETRVLELTDFVCRAGLRRCDNTFAILMRKLIVHYLNQAHDDYEYVLLHRDFWSDHIWRTASGICVIDYGRCTEGPKGRDVAQFYLRLGDLAVLNPFVSSRKVQSITHAYLEGYGAIDFSAPHLRLYLILCRLEHLGGLIESRRRPFMSKAINHLRIIAQIDWLLEESKSA